MKTMYTVTTKVVVNKDDYINDINLKRDKFFKDYDLKTLKYKEKNEIECYIQMYDAILDVLLDNKPTNKTKFYNSMIKHLNKFMSKFDILKTFKSNSLQDKEYDLENYTHDDILLTKEEGKQVYDKIKKVGSKKILEYIDEKIEDVFKFFVFILVLFFMIYYENVKDTETDVISINRIVYELSQEI